MPSVPTRFSVKPRLSRGFSLVEMLVVLAIISILAVSTLAAFKGTQNGLNLKGSAGTFLSVINLARQTAITRNAPVDVRIYKVEDSSGNGVQVYRTFQLVIPASYSSLGTDEFVGKPVSLAGDVIVDSDVTYSPLLSSTSSPWYIANESTSAPKQIQNMPYVKFTFLPTGSINYDTTVTGTTSASPSLTLINEHGKGPIVANTPAANYVTVVLDTVTGRASTYQP